MNVIPYRIGLVSCSKKKLSEIAAAGDLYCSDLAQKSLKHAYQECEEVWFVSGALGLISPDAIISPYDENRRVEIRYYGGEKKVTFINVLSGGIGQRLKWLKERIQ
jgi:hypothetical protein